MWWHIFLCILEKVDPGCDKTLLLLLSQYHQTSNISRTLVSNKLLITRCSCSIACRRCSNCIFILELKHLASMDCAKTTAKRDVKYFSLGSGGAYIRGLVVFLSSSYSIFVIDANAFTNSVLSISGGVLFSLEEGASFLNQSLTWRMVSGGYHRIYISENDGKYIRQGIGSSLVQVVHFCIVGAEWLFAPMLIYWD